MRVSKYPDKWQKRVFRLSPQQRAGLVDMAIALEVTIDAVARLAVYRHVRNNGRTLERWVPIGRAKAQAFFREGGDGDCPRTWVRLRPEWIAVLDDMRIGGYGAAVGVIRQAITDFHAAGPAEWSREFEAQAPVRGHKAGEAT